MKLEKNLLAVLLFPAVALLSGCDNPVDSDDDHLDEIAAVEVTDLSGSVLARYQSGQWTVTGDALHLFVGEETEVRIRFVAEDGDRFQIPPTGAEYTLRVEIANPAIASFEADADHGHFEGLAPGETTAKIQVMHGSHPDFETNPGLPIHVSSRP